MHFKIKILPHNIAHQKLTYSSQKAAAPPKILPAVRTRSQRTDAPDSRQYPGQGEAVLSRGSDRAGSPACPAETPGPLCSVPDKPVLRPGTLKTGRRQPARSRSGSKIIFKRCRAYCSRQTSGPGTWDRLPAGSCGDAKSSGSPQMNSQLFLPGRVPVPVFH